MTSRTVELHINQNIEELQEEERIDFKRLSWGQSQNKQF